MIILPILLFVIASSLDNFVVGLSYGIKKIKISLLNNLVVSSISGIGTFISMMFGSLFYIYIPQKSSSIIGSSILILFGLYFIFNSLRSKLKKHYDIKENGNTMLRIDYYDDILKHPELADKDSSNSIDIKESIILGIALSLNNIGLGIGASIIGLNIYISSLLSIIFSLIFVQIGFHIGSAYFSNMFEKYAEPISGIIIIILGFYELFM